MFRLAWRSIRVGTRQYFPFCVAAVFILDLFAVLPGSLFGSDWVFVVCCPGHAISLALPRDPRDYASLVDVCDSRRPILLALPRNSRLFGPRHGFRHALPSL